MAAVEVGQRLETKRMIKLVLYAVGYCLWGHFDRKAVLPLILCDNILALIKDNSNHL